MRLYWNSGWANRLYSSAKTACQFFFEIYVFTFLVSAFSSETDINIPSASFHNSKVSALTGEIHVDSSNITVHTSFNSRGPFWRYCEVHKKMSSKCKVHFKHRRNSFETFQYWYWWHLYLYFNLFKPVLMFVFHC